MFRAAPQRALRALKPLTPPSTRILLPNTTSRKIPVLFLRGHSVVAKYPSLLTNSQKPVSTSWIRHSTTKSGPPTSKDDAAGKVGFKSSPDSVTTTSSVRPILSPEVGEEKKPIKDIDMAANIRSEFQTIKETFSLSEVPREAYVLGLAGTLPYLATSLATLYCSWEINQAEIHATGFILSQESAEKLLHFLEPVQIGYGAVILSFLGAIHWGLEWAGYGGQHGYRRYAIGVVAPAVAWPTILFPIEYGLVTQFVAFNFLYYADSRATQRGWCPPWYSTYRFVLTFIVGASIVLSLIGRGEVADRVGRLPSAMDRVLQREEEERHHSHQESKNAEALGKKSE